MSKYVRTADGVYDKGKFIKEAIPLSDEVANALGIEVHPVIKEADKIEKLCDERVLSRYFPDTNCTIYGMLLKSEWDMMTKSVSARLKNGVTDCNLYGAIWTDKGLIYVAKLNAKGEMELL